MIGDETENVDLTMTPLEMKMETSCWLSSECSSRMATDKSALSLSIGCSTAGADPSCSCPVGGEKAERVLVVS
jgi:hypothetical protein